ncbi:MAG: DUF2807 domain-containing protein, partial [Rhodothermales bacterium]|nr:DUF2807 domain-containing protein [Rhodothermales bacterium]
MRALPLVLSLALVLAGCNVGIGTETVRGSGTATEEVREIRGGFNEVAISIPASLTIVQGKEPSLRLEGDDNLLPLIEVERDGRQLEIEADGVNLQPQTPLRVYVTVEELEGIRLAGSGDVEAAGLRTPRLEVS